MAETVTSLFGGHMIHKASYAPKFWFTATAPVFLQRGLAFSAPAGGER
jgi:hypothetical protein